MTGRYTRSEVFKMSFAIQIMKNGGDEIGERKFARMRIYHRLTAVGPPSCCSSTWRSVGSWRKQSSAIEFLHEKNQTVLVLGSGGLVGQEVVRWLRQNGYNIAHVRNRLHIDLREHGFIDRKRRKYELTGYLGALGVFNGTKIDHCMFLACEVGGSKFIESSAQNLQLGIIESNLRIYQNVLPWLADRKIPFTFTSSYLQGTENSYGVVKRLGEQWIRNLDGLGKTLRLWNVYGAEAIGLKSHVLSDWAQQCVQQGSATSRTDGLEERQFVHVSDVADALGVAMLHHQALPSETDISTGEWINMRTAANELEMAARQKSLDCHVSFSETPATHRERLSPKFNSMLHEIWQPQVSLRDGCRRVLESYLDAADCKKEEIPSG
ncbi:hypothetical protein GUITHDRAFT_166454 [Guillardia theta CCMP2712]|uniref:NAD-dependent epimerase/dehydratase domain-containing protein n=1 Tax=Guillardia theta (strain CCMP2712) TaxID=905079 RepID=L1IC79_GUITC|nr:hypothetical protein GUITHDRAFT_166454 [Guillardia theta CCMP2712]EKX33445.1 hypothetical protein GUITHDRAFT_166454 [Guillardia theta CCMP2712]|eukprot:XP_005820425.1 hypothetical protein GUITHDRAFT_166454 [Guillardia theta CCMP2712]